jgi:hypothetical protein
MKGCPFENPLLPDGRRFVLIVSIHFVTLMQIVMRIISKGRDLFETNPRIDDTVTSPSQPNLQFLLSYQLMHSEDSCRPSRIPQGA